MSLYFYLEPVQEVDTLQLCCPLPTGVSCEYCCRHLPNHAGDVDLDLRWHGYPDWMILRLHYSAPYAVIRNDLLAALEPHLSDFPGGTVSLHGIESPDYSVVVVPATHRCTWYSDDSGKFSHCPDCRSQFDGGCEEKWLSASEVAGRGVVSDPVGAELIASGDLVESLPVDIRGSLKLSPVLIRD